MPNTDRVESASPAVEVDEHERIPLYVLRMIQDSNERSSQAIGAGLNNVAAEVKDLRGDVKRLAPSPTLVAAGFGSLLIAGFAVIVFLIAGILLLRGVDPKQAGDAAEGLVEAVQPLPAAPPAGDE